MSLDKKILEILEVTPRYLGRELSEQEKEEAIYMLVENLKKKRDFHKRIISKIRQIMNGQEVQEWLENYCVFWASIKNMTSGFSKTKKCLCI